VSAAIISTASQRLNDDLTAILTVLSHPLRSSVRAGDVCVLRHRSLRNPVEIAAQTSVTCRATRTSGMLSTSCGRDSACRIRVHVMQTASIFRPSQRQQRRNAWLLAIALCVWLLAFATHVHADDEQGSSHARVTGCHACFSLPTGAPAPVAYSAEAPALRSFAVVVDLGVPVPNHPAPSSYLSRGPPAF
jgi:hypothetical protein